MQQLERLFMTWRSTMHTHAISGSASILALVSGAIFIAGCASAYNSGISEKGPNTYFLEIRTPSNKGGGNESLRQAKAQADEHCAKSGKKAEVTNQEAGQVTAEIFFTCAAK
jgi:hypothetical protein